MSNQIIDSFYKEVGDRIKYAIYEFNMKTGQKFNQTKLAKTIGVSYSSVSAMINGKRRPSLIHLVSIAKTLDVSTDFLLTLEEYKPRPTYSDMYDDDEFDSDYWFEGDALELDEADDEIF